MTDAEPLFLDTNILVYANVAEAPFHARAFDAIQRAHSAKRPLWISRQVLREYLAILTRPQAFTQPMPKDIAIERVRYFETRFQVADDTAAVTAQLLRLLHDFQIGGKQIHDTNIVATMQTLGIRCLLTHNHQDFKRFGALICLEAI